MDYIQCTNCVNCYELDDPFFRCLQCPNKEICYDYMCDMLLAGEIFATSDWTSEDINIRQLVITFHMQEENGTHQYRFLNLLA